MQLTQAVAQKMYNDAVGFWRQFIKMKGNIDIIVPDDYKIELNQHTSAWGSVRYSKRTIFLSQRMAEHVDYTHVYNTMLHEVLHTMFPKDGHKGNWKKWATLHNAQYTDIHGAIERSTTTPPSLRETKKYIIHCPKCGNKWYFDRMVKSVKQAERYHCTKCKVSLERIK